MPQVATTLFVLLPDLVKVRLFAKSSEILPD
jgi:hypothetical protein